MLTRVRLPRAARLGLLLAALLQVAAGGFGAWAHLRGYAPPAGASALAAGEDGHRDGGGARLPVHPAECGVCHALSDAVAGVPPEGAPALADGASSAAVEPSAAAPPAARPAASPPARGPPLPA